MTIMIIHCITQGVILRSRVNWYKQGETSSKYFLNLEDAKTKEFDEEIVYGNDKEMTAKQIMTEIHNFYSKLYDKHSYNLGENSITRFLDKTNATKLSNDQREVLDKLMLTRSELYQAFKTCQRNKTPGNDGLTQCGILFGFLAPF